MAIFTIKELHEKILSKDAYTNIANNRNTILPAFGKLTWAGWFKKYPKVAELVDTVKKLKIEQKIDNDIIPRDIYDCLCSIRYEQANDQDSTIKPLVDILKRVVSKQMTNSVSQYETLAGERYPFKKPRNVYRVAQNFWEVAIHVSPEFKGNPYVKLCDKNLESNLRLAVDDPEMYNKEDWADLFLLALKAGKENSISCKNKCEELLATLESKLAEEKANK